MSLIHRIAGAVMLCAATCGASAQSAYPNRPIHMIVPLAAASAVDNAARISALDIAGRQVQVGFQGLATVASLVRGGKLKLIGVTTPARLAQFGDVPTVAESGLPRFEFNSWFTIMAPAGTPPEIVARLNAEIVKALADPEVREKLAAQGLTIRGTSAQALGLATRDQLARYARLIKQSNITLD
jgi:tripartite-type tricarboxylate transporter receptor subunit TctC